MTSKSFQNKNSFKQEKHLLRKLEFHVAKNTAAFSCYKVIQLIILNLTRMTCLLCQELNYITTLIVQSPSWIMDVSRERVLFFFFHFNDTIKMKTTATTRPLVDRRAKFWLHYLINIIMIIYGEVCFEAHVYNNGLSLLAVISS